MPAKEYQQLIKEYQELLEQHPNSIPESGEADVRQNKRSPLADVPKRSPSLPPMVKDLVKKIEEAQLTTGGRTYVRRSLPNLPTKKDGT